MKKNYSEKRFHRESVFDEKTITFGWLCSYFDKFQENMWINIGMWHNESHILINQILVMLVFRLLKFKIILAACDRQ